MSRKCGQIRQASSDTTVRPTRQVSDTKNFFSATTVAASSYGLKTLRGALVSHFPDTETPCLARMSVIPHMRTGRTHRRRSATKRCPSCRTGAAPGSISPFPQDSQSPPPALARSRFHSTLSSSCSVAATRQFDTPQIRKICFQLRPVSSPVTTHSTQSRGSAPLRLLFNLPLLESTDLLRSRRVRWPLVRS